MLRNFILETSSAPGTAATINLAGAAAGRMSFASAGFASGSTPYYYMDDGTQAEWGVSLFTTGSPNTLARTTVLGNTAGTTARLNFAGTVRVYNEIPAEKMLFLDANGKITNAGLIALDTGTLALTVGGAIVGGANGGNRLTFANTNGLAVNQTGASAGNAYVANVSNTSSPLHLFQFSAATVGSITTNGSATAFNTTSDYRLKITYGLFDSGSVVDATPVYDGSWIAEPDVRRPMMLAHEVPAFAVLGEKDAQDAEGNPIYQQVDYLALIPVLWAAVQALRSQRNNATAESLAVGTLTVGGRSVLCLDDDNGATLNSIAVDALTVGGRSVLCLDDDNGATLKSLTVESGGVQVGTITARGGCAAYATVADYRVSNIFGQIDTAGDLIDATPVYAAELLAAPGERRPIMLAHEMPAFAVIGEKDAPALQQADYAALFPVMWAELRSLRRRVTILENKAGI